MPSYVLRVDVPAGATQAAGIEQSVEIDEQFIQDAEIFIDYGANGEVLARLFYGEQALFPAPAGEPAQKPGSTGPAPIAMELPSRSEAVHLRAWAPDADEPHVVIAEIETVDQQQRRGRGAGMGVAGPPQTVVERG